MLNFDYREVIQVLQAVDIQEPQGLLEAILVLHLHQEVIQDQLLLREAIQDQLHHLKGVIQVLRHLQLLGGTPVLLEVPLHRVPIQDMAELLKLILRCNNGSMLLIRIDLVKLPPASYKRRS